MKDILVKDLNKKLGIPQLNCQEYKTNSWNGAELSIKIFQMTNSFFQKVKNDNFWLFKIKKHNYFALDNENSIF